MIRYEFVYVYFIATKNVGDYSYMSSPNIYYRALKNIVQYNGIYWTIKKYSLKNIKILDLTIYNAQ